MELKPGDKVRYKDDLSRVYVVYAVYPTGVSLGLYDYPDVEADFITDINELERA
jgi:hypothetical protein